MSKRKLYIDGESSDDFDPGKPARRSKSTQQKKKLRGTSPQVGDLEAETKDEPHLVSLHILSSSETPRVALLAWFDVVCDSRGMPWRKQFDPSFGRDERAQRAYEVW
jgi:A/G-specific adenine glycosylase